MIPWIEFTQVIGKKENSELIKAVLLKMEVAGIVTETPDYYNDPLGKTVFHEFTTLGLEFGFRSGRLNHIHFFVQNHEGYTAYQGNIFDQLAQKWNYKKCSAKLGAAVRGAEGKKDVLLENINKWRIYAFEGYMVRMEFSPDGNLWKATLMATPPDLIGMSV